MKMLTMKMMFMTSTILPLIKTPMSMGILLLMQTLLMTLLINKNMSSSWLSMITFLMLIGGLLILFSYMSSIASNEKFKFNLKLILTTTLFMVITDETLTEMNMMEDQSMIWMEYKNQVSMIKLYNKKSMSMTMLMVIYLFMTMIMVSKMIKHYEGPLRSKN